MRHTAVAFLFAITLSICHPQAGGALESTGIPTPQSVLGFSVGDDFKLASYDESIGYFQRLDEVSDRLKLIPAGRTSEGRLWYVALISSANNLERLEHYRQLGQKLAHPDGLSAVEAGKLAREGKAFVDINGGLHASEAAGAQHTIQLAYDLLSHADDARVAEILDNVILLLWPSLNPDGQELVVEWYRSNLGTPFEVAPLVELYQKYIGHDNNRDAYMLNMAESRVLARTWQHYEPEIIYVHHQTAPFPTRIWIPPFAEPIAPRTPPLMTRTVNIIGMMIAEGLESKGMVGATHGGNRFDAWYPGYVDFLPMYQHRSAFWTETALFEYATPRFYTVKDFPEQTQDLRPEVLYSSPWPGGWWRLKDAVDYMVTASTAVLEYAAKYRERLLLNRYRSGLSIIEKYRKEPPFAYFVPVQQRDPVAAVEMLRRLAFNGIRISRVRESVSFEGLSYPPGSWVIPMDQEFSELVRELFQEQEYPDVRQYPDGPVEQTFDVSGWTLPYQMDVTVVPAMSPLTPEFRSALVPVQSDAYPWEEAYSSASAADRSPFDSVGGAGFDTNAVAAGIHPAPGQISGSGALVALDPSANNAFRALNGVLSRGGRVRFEPGNDDSEGSGHYIVEGASSQEISHWTADLALNLERQASSSGPSVGTTVGLYRPWRASMDEGWTRWLLEQYQFNFSNLRNLDFQRNSLDRFGVIILPDEDTETLSDGFRHGVVPPRYEGGIGQNGIRNLDNFVREGGTLVCLNRSSDFAISALRLPVVNVVADLGPEEFHSAGSILEVIVNGQHPVMAGMPPRARIMFDQSPVFAVREDFKGVALARYEPEGSPLLSGYLLGKEHIQGYAAALDVEYGKGHVLLIGFRPQWRGQPFGTFRVLFNASLFAGDLASRGYSTTDFWSSPALSLDGDEMPAEESAKQEGR